MTQHIEIPDLSELKKKYNSGIVRVDIGCGPFKPNNYIGVDIHPGEGVDIVADLSQYFPFPDNSIDELRAHDVIEHLPKPLHTMNEIWRVCKAGATVDIFVPSTDGRGAFQDPTHVSFWNVNSFLYYCIDFPGYYELCKKYGFKGSFKVLTLEQQDSGNMVIHVIAKLLVVKEENNLENDYNTNIITKSDSTLIYEEIEQLKTASIEETPLILKKLQQTRRELAEQWLKMEQNKIKKNYQGELGKTTQLLRDYLINKKPLREEDQTFIEEIEAKIVNEASETHKINQILALILYRHPYQIPGSIKLSDIPQWLIEDYLKLLFEPTHYFQEIGEADNYCKYISLIVGDLEKQILKHPKSDYWQKILSHFFEISNFISIYFNETNLKELYRKRAKLIGQFLSLHNLELSAQFTAVSPRQKIRLGILALDFGTSAETFASLPVYEYLSRDFEVILYCFGKVCNSIEKYCESCANQFKILPIEIDKAVNFLRNDELDILFFGTNVNVTVNPVTILAFHRLARIQLTSVSSVVTTGIENIDYYLSGTLTDPYKNAQEHYTENLIKLEGSAHCFSYGDQPETLTITVTREDLGISPETIVFISTANFYKITPELIKTWATIIARVPGAILIILPFGPNWSDTYPKEDFINYFHKKFTQYHVKSEQIRILDPHPTPNREDIKEFMKIADIYLDSYPFSSTTSLIEPLEVGLPVISRKGENLRSSMGGAMLEALGIPDLVTNSEISYIERAITLGNSLQLRQEKSQQIQQKILENPPFLDSKAYAAKIEPILKNILVEYQNKELKKEFRLNDINLILFPDWNQSEEIISEDLATAFKKVFDSPQKGKITLLIDITNFSEETSDMIVSSIVMMLLMDEEIDCDSGVEISLIGNLTQRQWQAFQPLIHGRLPLQYENTYNFAYSSLKYLPIFDI